MRIRTIKPEFWESERLGRVSRSARLLFVGLFNCCDDSGRTRAASRILASRLFPYDDDALQGIDGWLAELEREGCIRRYMADGDLYLDIPKWDIHQKIDKPTKSKIPEFAESSRILAESSRKIALEQGTGNREQGSGTGNRESACGASPRVPETLNLETEQPAKSAPTVDEVYEAYPLKKARIDAIAAITKALKRGVEADRLLSATKAFADAVALWPESERKFIPNPATWYNRGSYDDDPKTWARSNASGGESWEDLAKRFGQ